MEVLKILGIVLIIIGILMIPLCIYGFKHASENTPNDFVIAEFVSFALLPVIILAMGITFVILF